jgi:hypothetical protein
MSVNASAWTPLDRSRLHLKKMQAEDRLMVNRLIRWQRQSVARSIVPGERVAKCYRVRVRELVDVMRSKKFKRAHYGGLFTCTSVWSCPVCAAKITERRRIELQQAVDKAISKGITFFMVTWTLQHTKQDTLRDVRDSLGVALRKLRAGRWYQGFIEDWDIVGNVTGSEVTYGTEFGWHYHKHSIFFSNKVLSDLDLQNIQLDLSSKYRSILEKMGRYAHPLIGVHVRSGDSAVADYIAKYGQQRDISNWSLAAEITKGSSKNALQESDHFTPFELLDLALHQQDDGSLFREYVNTMKGDHQIRWSADLRAALDLGDEITDEEIASAQDEDAYLFAQVTLSQWRKILRNEKRGQLLEVASMGDVDLFQKFLLTIS